SITVLQPKELVKSNVHVIASGNLFTYTQEKRAEAAVSASALDSLCIRRSIVTIEPNVYLSDTFGNISLNLRYETDKWSLIVRLSTPISLPASTCVILSKYTSSTASRCLSVNLALSSSLKTSMHASCALNSSSASGSYTGYLLT